MQSHANVTDECKVILRSFSRFQYRACGISCILCAFLVIVCCEFLRLCVPGATNFRANAVHGCSGGDESCRCELSCEFWRGEPAGLNCYRARQRLCLQHAAPAAYLWCRYCLCAKLGLFCREPTTRLLAYCSQCTL